MRFLVLCAIAVINLIFTGTVFPNLNVAGLAPDIIVCTTVSLAILEKRMTGAILGLICGLLLDLMFSGAVGFYAIPYFLTGGAAYAVSLRLRYVDSFLVPGWVAVGAFVFKEILRAMLAYMMGINFSLGQMLIRYILPEALMTGVLMLLIHTIIRRIYRSGSVRPKSMGDLKKLV